MTDAILTTDRLLLRPHNIDDFANYRQFWTGQAFDGPGGPPQTEEEIWMRLVFYIGHWNALRYGMFLAIDPITDAIVGELGFRRMKRSVAALTGGREAGWNVAQGSRGSGLATEAMSKVRDWMDRRHPGRQTCFVTIGNDASIRLAAKLGFEPVSIHQYSDVDVQLFERSVSVRLE